jgi:hypothetical protein
MIEAARLFRSFEEEVRGLCVVSIPSQRQLTEIDLGGWRPIIQATIPTHPEYVSVPR